MAMHCLSACMSQQSETFIISMLISGSQMGIWLKGSPDVVMSDMSHSMSVDIAPTPGLCKYQKLSQYEVWCGLWLKPYLLHQSQMGLNPGQYTHHVMMTCSEMLGKWTTHNSSPPEGAMEFNLDSCARCMTMACSGMPMRWTTHNSSFSDVGWGLNPGLYTQQAVIACSEMQVQCTSLKVSMLKLKILLRCPSWQWFVKAVGNTQLHSPANETSLGYDACSEMLMQWTTTAHLQKSEGVSVQIITLTTL